MKAVIYEKYGSSDMLKLVDLSKPKPAGDQILIKIHAVSINGSDREGLIGKPLYARTRGLFRPGGKILGSDIAGTVEAVGGDHTEFQVGDEVFGELPGYHGGFAEYAVTHGRTLTHKLPGLTFEQAAAIPQAGVIALYGIREKGQVQPGQKVLINGAGGSGGTFAIQLAKHYMGPKSPEWIILASWSSCARWAPTMLLTILVRTSPGAASSTT
jgi:NADPH:quinone reductase-like Zn-dependent oxidoreductase